MLTSGLAPSAFEGMTLKNWQTFSDNGYYINCKILSGGNLKLQPIDDVKVTLNNTFLSNTIVNVTANNAGIAIIRRLSFRATFINCVVNITSVKTGAVYSIQKSYFSGSMSNSTDGLLITDCAFADGYQITGQSVNTIFGTVDGVKFSVTVNLGGFNIIFNNCFWTATAGFNNPSIEDYTLMDSPRSILWNNSNVLGTYEIGVRFLPSNPAFDPVNGAVYVGVNRNTVNESFELTASPSGTVESSTNPNFALNFGELVTLDNALLWFGLVPPLDVVQLTKYDGLSANPTVRLDYEFNIYDESEPNGANNPLNFIGWRRMEVNMPVQVDAGGLGNGNQDALLTNIGSAIVNRFALRFTIREDGN